MKLFVEILYYEEQTITSNLFHNLIVNRYTNNCKYHTQIYKTYWTLLALNLVQNFNVKPLVVHDTV